MEVQDQRVRFVIAASRSGQNMSELCREFGISRPTGYQWLERYRTAGVAGIREKSRRPQRSPRRTGTGIEERISELRRERPDWGARKLAVLLEQEGIAVPRATIHRVLLRLGLVRLEDRRSAASSRFQREQPNQLWQMDFKSPKGWGSNIGPLSVLDDATRYVVALKSTGSNGRRWQVAGPLASELVQLERVGQRVLVFYCNTLIRELNLTVEQEGKDGGPAALENTARFPLSLPAAAAVGQP